MTTENLPEFVRALLLPETYPHPVSSVELIQTHISYVTLAGEYVYKWKKPVDFGFLDFSTLEKREYYCGQEIQLNQRLCPDLYLDVVTLYKNEQGFAFSGGGEPVEYAVRMRRMNQEGLMNKLVAAGSLNKEHMDRIVAMLVPFYPKAVADESVVQFGTAQGFGVNVHENFEQTEGFIGKGGLTRELFDTVKEYSLGFLANTELFDKRISEGKVCDCHGDLYSANICFDDDKTYIFDCIEFNERFRYSDLCGDVGFLAMDLDFHGLTDLSQYFVQQYREKSGDDSLIEVLNFYKCYRAYVRAKIGLFTAADPALDPAVAKQCLCDAEKYFALARRYALA